MNGLDKITEFRDRTNKIPKICKQNVRERGNMMKARIKCERKEITGQVKRCVTGLHVCKNVAGEMRERIQCDDGCHSNAVTRKRNVLRAQPALHIY